MIVKKVIFGNRNNFVIEIFLISSNQAYPDHWCKVITDYYIFQTYFCISIVGKNKNLIRFESTFNNRIFGPKHSNI